jgi:hypothetical protein
MPRALAVLRLITNSNLVDCRRIVLELRSRPQLARITIASCSYRRCGAEPPDFRPTRIKNPRTDGAIFLIKAILLGASEGYYFNGKGTQDC